MDRLSIPNEVVRANVTANGEAGRVWLEALPGMVDELTRRWRLTLGPAFEGGVVAFVAPAQRPDGPQVVLKVSFIDEETRHEADALRAWDGDGAVALLDADAALGAMLLERLEPGTSLEDHTHRDQAISIACVLLRHLWRPPPYGHPFLLVSELARRWSRELPGRFERLGAPFEQNLLERAIEECEEFARSSDETVLANRDYHLGNVLAAGRRPWLMIDPKPLAGERAFDTGHLLRSLLPREQDPDGEVVEPLIRRLAAELELEPDRIRSWALVRSIEDALWWLEVGGSGPGWDVACARILAHP
jgi:streptomycin 6-kinase